MMLSEDEEFGLAVVDLAKGHAVAGPRARSSTQNSNRDKALVGVYFDFDSLFFRPIAASISSAWPHR